MDDSYFPPMSDALKIALGEAVASSKSPGAVACVGNRTTILFHEAVGLRQRIPETLAASKDTIYDLASLTKVVATTTAVLLLKQEGALDLDRPVSNYLPIPAFGRFTVRHCLTHTTGLIAGRPYYKECSSLNEMLQRYASEELSWTPGEGRHYSDVGFMILCRVVELVAQDSLDAFCAKRIFKPLGMLRTAFNPPKEWAGACAATERCAWRGKVIVGVVHDENAYAVGGVSGHAGLFSTAEDLARFCQALLGGDLLSGKTLAEMTKLGQVFFYPWQGLGWKLDPWQRGSEGFLPSRAAFGHTGWTGTSLWLDRDRGFFAVLLSNTCHPSRENRDTETLRRVFHQAVARELYPGRSNTHTGLDRLAWNGFEAIRGKRLAVLTNRAAVDELGRPALDVMAFDHSASVRRIYSPEHGFHLQAEAGQTVSSEKTSIPITSLYGDRKAPSPEELADIDLFVVDLPDVGARYYTYMATMRDALMACAKTNKAVLVLDRPNPIGGAVLEGPIAEQYSSSVCWGPIPIRHGMTIGEVATYFKKTLPSLAQLNLTVSTLDGWPRDYLFSQCSLPWVAPSPNMPTPETALLYVGFCLFEGTNLNEGRGTDTPFQIIGAPWLDAAAIAAMIASEERPGCVIEATAYTPRALPGKASDPAYRDEHCQGIRIAIQEPAAVRAFTTAIALLRAVAKRHPREFAWKETFDTLAGTPELRRWIEHGDPALEIVSRYGTSLQAFDKMRPSLYE